MWVPSFLWAKRTLTWNAGHIRIASNGSAPPWMRKPGAQPLRGAGLHSAASHVGCRACDWMLPKSCVPWSFHFWWQYKYHHWFAFLVNSNRKASMLRLRPWSLGIFLETHHFGKVLSHKFLAHFLTWWPGPWGHHPCKRALMRWMELAVLSEAVSVALPCLPWLKPSFSSHRRFTYLLTLYFTAGILVCSCRISLFHPNNQQCEAVI